MIYSRQGRVYRVSAHGGRARVIAMGMMPFFAGDLLSPDGRTLALQTNGVTTINIATGHRRTVLTAAQVKALNHDQLANEISPLAWYPDGTRLLMIALNQSRTHCYTFAIGLDGRGYERVGPKGFCPLRATYSGDGGHFAFVSVSNASDSASCRRPRALTTCANSRSPQTVISINLAWNPLRARG